MDPVATFTERNAAFASHQHDAGLRMMPSTKTLLLGCVDPRVDPSAVLGVELGEAAIVRNVGGRVTPGVLDELALLAEVSRAAGGQMGPGWNLIVLHHTDCGITRLGAVPGQVARFLGTDEGILEAKAVGDPRVSVVVDIDVLRGDLRVSSEFTVSGLVYDVETGLVDTVVKPQQLRS